MNKYLKIILGFFLVLAIGFGPYLLIKKVLLPYVTQQLRLKYEKGVK